MSQGHCVELRTQATKEERKRERERERESE